MARSNRRKVRNARQLPQVYYGLHMAPGVAEYEEETGISRILITEPVIKAMNPSFRGKPIYVLHQETVLDTLHEQLDGTVVRSFYNRSDGMTWSEFTVHTDAAHDAIANGWKLSNSYLITDTAGGGRWHNVPYDEEVLGGIFEHLALVPNPRYEESMILTPEEFAAYNERKEAELRTLQNSKKELNTMGFRLIQKKKVTNADQLASATIELEDGTTVPFSRALRMVAADAIRRKSNAKKRRLSAADILGDDDLDEPAPRARRRSNDGDAAVGLEQEITVGDRVMTIRELVQKFLELDGQSANNASDDDEDEDERKKKKENAKRRKLAAARANAADQGDGDDDLDDEEEDDTVDNSLDDDSPELDEDGDPIEPDEGADDQADDLEGEDDLGQPRARRNARQTLRANGKDKKNGKRNQRDRRKTRENAEDEGGGKTVRVSPAELKLLRESRKIHASSLRNARDSDRGTDTDHDEEEILDTAIDQLRRGKELYTLDAPGSKDKH